MWGQEQNTKPRNFKIFVVKSIDGVVDKIEGTYLTGIREFVFVPINEAKRSAEKLGNGHFIATDDLEIAQQYGLRLIQIKYQ